MLAIPAFAELIIDGSDAALWLPHVAGRPVRTLFANNCNLTNAQIAEIAALPQLQEVQVCWNDSVTDLSPLLACETLEKVVVNYSNVAAIASIEGKANFTIEYQE